MSTVGYMRYSLDEGAFVPVREHEHDAGFDLRTPVDLVIPAHGYAFVNTGVHFELPSGTAGHVRSKSGLNRYHGITADGTVDEGYTGPVGVILHNDGDEDHEFRRGDKVAQMVVEEIRRPAIICVAQVAGGERGDDGYGSTGV